MSEDQARALLKRFRDDREFRTRLVEAPHEQRHAIVSEAGFGDVEKEHADSVAHEFEDDWLTEEEIREVAAAGTDPDGVEWGAFAFADVPATVASLIPDKW